LALERFPAKWIPVRVKLEHDPEKHASGDDPTGGNRFCLATNAERVCRACRETSARSSAGVPAKCWDQVGTKIEFVLLGS
jgi:hypothetical protein